MHERREISFEFENKKDVFNWDKEFIREKLVLSRVVGG